MVYVHWSWAVVTSVSEPKKEYIFIVSTGHQGTTTLATFFHAKQELHMPHAVPHHYRNRLKLDVRVNFEANPQNAREDVKAFQVLQMKTWVRRTWRTPLHAHMLRYGPTAASGRG